MEGNILPLKPNLILQRHANYKCMHNKFIIDEKLAHVECGICGDSLNPMWVLNQLCAKEARAWQNLERLNKIAKKADEKNRCKCEKCGEMTRIQK